MAATRDDTGLTKDAGWEVGVRTTVPAALPDVWAFLVGPGLPLWLGETKTTLAKGATYETRDGVRGDVRSYKDNAMVRLTWHPEDWPHDTTLQVRVKEAVTGTTISFHQERLADREERKMMLGHWKAVAEHLAGELGAARKG